MEERGPIPIETLVKVIRDSGIHANPDMGNFRDEEATETGLRLMYPLAITVSHVKWNPEKFDFAKVVEISKEMNFKGVYSHRNGAALSLMPGYKHSRSISGESLRNAIHTVGADRGRLALLAGD